MSKPRILVLLEGGDAYPSGIVRGLVYREHFERAGYEAIYMNRRLPALARLIHRPPRLLGPLTSRPPGSLGIYGAMEVVSRAYEGRILSVARTCDLVYMSKVRSLRFTSRLRAATRAPIILDFGDSVWLQRGGESFNELLRLVDAVTTDNEFTARHVREHNPHCTVIPDTPQVDQFDRLRGKHRRKASDDAVTIGWIGSPLTLFNLFAAWPALEKIFRRRQGLRLRLVGSGSDPRLLPPFEHVRWTARPSYDQAAMIEEVLSFDIGLFPMFDVENSVVRGALKAMIYMAGEAVPVCSPIGQVPDVVTDGYDGVLADGVEEWTTKLERLIGDSHLRQEMAANALATIRSRFTLESSFTMLKNVIDGHLGRGHQN
ncbi:MAG: glycosyltransferase [Thermoanaerobaculia bacterium]